jgi:hypothetical protein
MALDGITRLIAVTQMKADAASSNLNSQATKQFGTMPSLHDALHTAADNFKYVKAASPGTLPGLHAKLDVTMTPLESRDRVDNFQIQNLMSTYNEAEARMRHVLSALEGATTGVTGKF